MFVFLPPLWELAETFGLWINRAFESANGHFVIIARVDHGNIRGRDQFVPFFRRNISAHDFERISFWHTHRDDLALQAHLEAAKGHFGGCAFFPFKRRTTRQVADMG